LRLDGHDFRIDAFDRNRNGRMENPKLTAQEYGPSSKVTESEKLLLPQIL